MFSQTTIIGRVGKDPESREVGGHTVATVSVAVSKRWTGNDGQRRERTVWFRCTAWRRQAEIIMSFVKKGDLITLVGEMEEPSAWLPRDGGDPRAQNEMTISQVTLMPNQRSEQQGARAGGPPIDDEDIPF